MARILVTGFEPFGGEKINPAAQILKRLSVRNGTEVVTREIPTVFGVSAKTVQDAIVELMPKAVISVGQAGGATGIRVERVALNLDDAKHPDNAGNCPNDTPIDPQGPLAYWATIPVRQVVEAIRQRGIPADISYTAGTFVCNHAFYSTCHFVHTHKLPIMVGFLHVPYLPQQTIERTAVPSMSEDCMMTALDAVVRVVAESL